MFKGWKIALVGTLLAVSVVTWPRAEAARSAPGVGETLILAVAAELPDATQARRAVDGINRRFGELQGFYVDAAANYAPVGLLEQVSPDTKRYPCPNRRFDCPPGRDHVEAFEPIVLAHAEVTPADVATGWLVLTAFRTRVGAQEFAELVRAMGLGRPTFIQARKLGGGDIGLGQEPHPNGRGPLLGPLPDQERYQR